jgi:mono/diheme cytochrome c family protein
MKVHVIVSVLAVVAILVLANVVKNEKEEAAANRAFKESVKEGEKVYRSACGRCHEPYDPRFLTYEAWAAALDDRGCVRVSVPLEAGQAGPIKDFLRAKGAPTEAEAETVQSRERARFLSERVRRGGEVYKAQCANCHRHPYFIKIRTAAGWREVMADLAASHQGVNEPVWVEEAQVADLDAFLAARGAGTPNDARAIQALLTAGAGTPEEIPEEGGDHTIHWVRDYEKGMKEAREKNLPVILDITDLSGG